LFIFIDIQRQRQCIRRPVERDYQPKEAAGGSKGEGTRLWFVLVLSFDRLSTHLSLEILKKQAAQNFKEYDRVSTELNDLRGQKSNKRVD